MALASYSDLQASVAAWLLRSDLTTVIPDLIRLGEGTLNRRLRSFRMLNRTTLAVTGEFTALPSDFLAIRALRNADTADVIRCVSQNVMDDDRATYDYSAGAPLRYSLESQGLRLSPVPSPGLNASLLYYGALPPLASNTTNWLLTLYPSAYLYAALMQSAPFLRADNRMPMWKASLDTIVTEINATDSGWGGALDPQPSTFAAGNI